MKLTVLHYAQTEYGIDCTVLCKKGALYTKGITVVITNPRYSESGNGFTNWCVD
jgi:hypothetical protein